jgi:hypothetical protein
MKDNDKEKQRAQHTIIFYFLRADTKLVLYAKPCWKYHCRGVNKFFSSSVFSLAKSENNWPKIKKGSVRVKKNNLDRLASGFVFLLAKSGIFLAFGELASGYLHPCQ